MPQHWHVLGNGGRDGGRAGAVTHQLQPSLQGTHEQRVMSARVGTFIVDSYIPYLNQQVVRSNSEGPGHCITVCKADAFIVKAPTHQQRFRQKKKGCYGKETSSIDSIGFLSRLLVVVQLIHLKRVLLGCRKEDEPPLEA